MFIPEGYGQINLIMSGDSAPTGAQCTFGFQIAGVGLSPEQAADAWGDAWQNNIMPNLSSSLSFDAVLAKFGPNETGPFFLQSRTATGGGAAAGEAPMVAILAQKQTGFGGRAGRGRIFIPGIPAASVDTDGAVAGAVITALNDDLADLLLAVSVADVPAALLHNDPGLEPYEITALTVASQAATQRRRNRR